MREKERLFVELQLHSCCVSFVSLDIACHDLSDGVKYVGAFVNEVMSNALVMSTVIVRGGSCL